MKIGQGADEDGLGGAEGNPGLCGTNPENGVEGVEVGVVPGVDTGVGPELKLPVLSLRDR